MKVSRHLLIRFTALVIILYISIYGCSKSTENNDDSHLSLERVPLKLDINQLATEVRLTPNQASNLYNGKVVQIDGEVEYIDNSTLTMGVSGTPWVTLRGNTGGQVSCKLDSAQDLKNVRIGQHITAVGICNVIDSADPWCLISRSHLQ